MIDEVVWRKSSYSGPHDNCVTVSTLAAGARAVKDSKDPARGVIVFARGEWSAFVSALRLGSLGA